VQLSNKLPSRSLAHVLRAALVVGALVSPSATFAETDQTQTAIDDPNLTAIAVPAVTTDAPAFDVPATATDAPEPLAPVASVDAPSRVLPTPTITPSVVADHQYGMNLFVWSHPDTTNRDLGVVQQAGFTWQKSLFEWRMIEGNCKGCFDWQESDRVARATATAGLKLLVRIDFEPDWARADHAHNGRPDNLQDYSDFVAAVAARYKPGSPYGHVDAIEIWNEPNLQREWGEAISQQSAINYVQMVKGAYQAIKAVSPTTQVVTAGLSPTGWSDDSARPDDQFLKWMFDAGLSGNYDVLGLHGNSQAPDATAAPGSLPGMTDGSFYFRRVEQLRQVQVAAGDANKPVWLLEFGWTADAVHPAYSWFAVTEDQKASNLMASFQYARANWPWLGTMFVWTLPDPSWNKDREEYWWAIADPDGTPRAALKAILGAAQARQLPA
jgi:polysaccharide biosynthesis protein PslG